MAAKPRLKMLQASFRGGGGRYQFNVIPNRSLTAIFLNDFDVDRAAYLGRIRALGRCVE